MTCVIESWLKSLIAELALMHLVNLWHGPRSRFAYWNTSKGKFNYKTTIHCICTAIRGPSISTITVPLKLDFRLNCANAHLVCDFQINNKKVRTCHFTVIKDPVDYTNNNAIIHLKRTNFCMDLIFQARVSRGSISAN